MNALRISVVLAAALVAPACVAAPSSARAVSGTGGSAARSADRVALVAAGVEQELLDGEEIPIYGTLAAKIRITPLPGVAYARILQLTLLRGETAVTDATVRASARMRFMDHGSFQVVAVPSGNGGYVAPLQFAMAGEWAIVVAIRTADEAGDITIDLDAFD